MVRIKVKQHFLDERKFMILKAIIEKFGVKEQIYLQNAIFNTLNSKTKLLTSLLFGKSFDIYS